MATRYELVENAILAALTEPVGAPFATNAVVTYGAQLTDAEVAEELQRLHRPGAMVFYAGGETDRRTNDALTEDAVFTLVLVAAGRSPTAAVAGDAQSLGIYDLLDWCRGALHGLRNNDTLEPLIWRRQYRLRIPGVSLTVAAFAADIDVRILWE